MSSLPIPRTKGSSIKDAPDHHDAELVLRLYEIRQEASLREARSFFSREFWPASAQAALAVTRFEHPQNAFWRQVSSYWEMAYGMARHGIVNPDYLVENTSEGLFFFAKLQPWLAELRVDSPRSLLHTEWMATECAMGRNLFAHYRGLVEKALAARRPS